MRSAGLSLALPSLRSIAWSGPFRRLALTSLVTLTALATACARPNSATSPLNVTGADTLFYVSARARDEGRATLKLADSLEFGLFVMARTGRPNAQGERLERTLVDSTRLSEGDFVHLLGERLSSSQRASDVALLYVHGFGTSLHEAWQHAATARALSRAATPWVIFAWPSNGAGIAPPRRGAIMAAAYKDDSLSAVASAPAFLRAVRVLVSAVGSERLMILAHSLGSQLVGETLATDDSLRAVFQRAPLRAIAFANADVDATRFADVFVPALSPLAQRVVLYASTRDRLLGISRRMQHAERAGLIRGRPIIRPGLETVDVSRSATTDTWLQRVFGLRHAVRRATGTLLDIANIVAPGLPATCRLTLGTATLEADGVWSLTREPIPVGDRKLPEGTTPPNATTARSASDTTLACLPP